MPNIRSYQQILVERMIAYQDFVSVSSIIGGSMMTAVVTGLYPLPLPKVREPQIGPRDWSPRTGKCLCKKPHPEG